MFGLIIKTRKNYERRIIEAELDAFSAGVRAGAAIKEADARGCGVVVGLPAWFREGREN